MKTYKPFLLWWIIFITSLAGFVVASEYGLIHKMWSLDISKISFMILAIYTIASGYCGWIAFHINRRKININKHLSILWFVSGGFVILGLIGTVIGFMVAFADIITPTGSFSTNDIKSMIQALGSGLAVAFTTTLVGFISSLLIKTQLVVVEFFKNG